MNVEEHSIKHYFDQRAQWYGHDIKSVQWRDEHRQRIRFDQIRTFLTKSRFSLLDVGCGKGDFFDYLLSMNAPVCYAGIDLSAFMVSLAKEGYPRGVFEQGDLLGMVGEGMFDYVVASGVFNLNVEDMYCYLEKRLSKMVSLASCGVIFNFLSNDVSDDYKQVDLFNYYDKRQVFDLCASFGDIDVLDGYLEHDVTVSILFV